MQGEDIHQVGNPLFRTTGLTHWSTPWAVCGPSQMWLDSSRCTGASEKAVTMEGGLAGQGGPCGQHGGQRLWEGRGCCGGSKAGSNQCSSEQGLAAAGTKRGLTGRGMGKGQLYRGRVCGLLLRDPSPAGSASASSTAIAITKFLQLCTLRWDRSRGPGRTRAGGRTQSTRGRAGARGGEAFHAAPGVASFPRRMARHLAALRRGLHAYLPGPDAVPALRPLPPPSSQL